MCRFVSLRQKDKDHMLSVSAFIITASSLVIMLLCSDKIQSDKVKRMSAHCNGSQSKKTYVNRLLFYKTPLTTLEVCQVAFY